MPELFSLCCTTRACKRLPRIGPAHKINFACITVAIVPGSLCRTFYNCHFGAILRNHALKRSQPLVCSSVVSTTLRLSESKSEHSTKHEHGITIDYVDVDLWRQLPSTHIESIFAAEPNEKFTAAFVAVLNTWSYSQL